MNDNRTPPETGRETGRTAPSGDDRIERLLRLAGPRESAPREREERVRTALHAVWNDSVRVRRRRRIYFRGGALLAAAAALLAVFGLLDRAVVDPLPVAEGPVATVQAVSGIVRARQPGSLPGAGTELRVGDSVAGGMIVDTGVLGRTALRLAGGPSLRLDFGTRLVPLTDSAVTLESGALYFDSGEETSGAPPVEIRTGLGVVRHVGTQFEVRLASEGMRLRVREGVASLENEGRVHEAEAGTELTVDGAGSLSRRAVPGFGPDWDWVLDVAPPFELEGSTLDVFLTWVRRETGWQIRFAEERSEAGSSTVLHGSIEDMRPDQALEAVLPTCGLAHSLESGILLVEADAP